MSVRVTMRKLESAKKRVGENLAFLVKYGSALQETLFLFEFNNFSNENSQGSGYQVDLDMFEPGVNNKNFDAQKRTFWNPYNPCGF